MSDVYRIIAADKLYRPRYREVRVASVRELLARSDTPEWLPTWVRGAIGRKEMLLGTIPPRIIVTQLGGQFIAKPEHWLAWREDGRIYRLESGELEEDYEPL